MNDPIRSQLFVPFPDGASLKARLSAANTALHEAKNQLGARALEQNYLQQTAGGDSGWR